MENKFTAGLLGDINYEDILESIPIGTLVFQVTDNEVEVVSINERLIQFANLVHTYIDSDDIRHWGRKELYQAFQNNIYAFAQDEDIRIVEKMIKDAAADGYAQCVFRLRGTAGENTKWISSVCTSKLLEDNKRIYYTLFMDYTNQVLYERQLLDKQKELEHISSYDSLTNVKNRYSYNCCMNQGGTEVRHNTGILFANVNGLKAANDKYGHIFGDSILVELSDIMKRYFSQEDIYRISGDEFVIIENNISVDKFEQQVAKLLRDNEEKDIASIGYIWETAAIDMKQEIYKAEQLMLIQKQNYYIQNYEVESKHKPKILKGLLDDLSNNRYVVYLQPKARINSTRVDGAEALIRKIDEEGHIIQPYQFVPVLEKELLISSIDFFVLEEVCRLLDKWKDNDTRLIKISVNMSRVSIAEQDFLEHILRICDKYQVDHNNIEFEITESTETRDDRKLYEIVENLHNLGFGVALDDMGSDYSSIKMLTMPGVDMVKLDRSMILKLEQKEGAALIRYVIALCHEIGKRCIAEGVENQEQVAMLEDMSCDYYQGFLLSRPVPISEFEEFIKD